MPVKSSPLATPSPQQLLFADLELGAFFHFGISTYTGRPHEIGRASPSTFDPVDLDMRQWITAASAIGARYAVLTARHEDGFCLWPTNTTDYNVRHTSWRNGRGDVVREFVEACHEADIMPGLYFSPAFNGRHVFRPEDDPQWGENQDVYWNRMSEQEFADFKAREIAQAVELIERYRPFYIWCDHNFCERPGHRMHEVTVETTRAMTNADPNLLILGPHVWTTGNELGHTTYPLWNAVNTVDETLFSRPRATSRSPNSTDQFGLLETDVHSGHPLGKFWRPVEAVTDRPFGNGMWFHSADGIHDNSGDEVLDTYYLRTVGFGSNLMINFSPDPSGLVPEAQISGARKFGHALQSRFADPIAETQEEVHGDVVELSWAVPREVRYVVLMENLEHGQKVASYVLEAWVDGEWLPMVSDNAAGFLKEERAGFETIGHKKIDVVQPVTTTRVRFRCLTAVAEAVTIRRMQLYGRT